MDIEKVCWKICSTFDYDETTNPFQWGSMKDGKPPGLTMFIDNLVKKDQWKKMKSRNEKLTQRDRDIFEESLTLTYQIPFAFGYVIDWINLAVFPFSVFNIADISIVTGVFLIAVLSLPRRK